MIVLKLIRSFLASVVARFEFPIFGCQAAPVASNLRPGLCALDFVDAARTGESRHRHSLKIRVDIVRPAGLTATRPVMRNLSGARGFAGPNLIHAISACFHLQALFLFLPAIAHILVSAEYCILCTHDFPSITYDELL